MRKLAILTFVTLDGVMQSPSGPTEDPSGNFTHGGWAQNWWNEVMEQVMQEAMADPYDFIFGRKTYDIFAPEHSDKAANPQSNFHQAVKYVVSNTLENPVWHNSQVIDGDFIEKIKAIKQKDGALLQVHGSGQLIQALLQHNLIDEFRIWTFPCIIGSGKKLFADNCVAANLELTKSATTKNGVVMTIYKLKTPKDST